MYTRTSVISMKTYRHIVLEEFSRNSPLLRVMSTFCFIDVEELEGEAGAHHREKCGFGM